ncbi:GNAT family N-acetyltransferase [Macrococcus animalis]|uniref:GNAT family N-acetyltransferase n=1 Tax=Macrococcus animalis TaxID=3395467 RepID=UPI0039BDF65A
MILNTERLILKRPNTLDINSYMIIRNSDEYYLFNPLPKLTHNEATHFFISAIKNNSIIGIYLDQKMIGVIDIFPDQLRYGVNSVSISYALNTAYTVHGYMKEALSVLVCHYKKEKRYDIITARVYQSNIKSHRLLEKIGFVKEGILKHAVKGNFDMIHDDYLYAFYIRDI